MSETVNRKGMLMKKLALMATLLLMAGCNGGGSGGVKTAVGENSVKFVICAKAEANCFVSARFRDLNGCQNYKHWAGMLCNTNPDTGQLMCSKPKNQMQAYAYCEL